eukprot:6099295-Pleurochrysis_carterae.AAC.1
MVVITITNDHFFDLTGWSLQVDPVKYLMERYTPNEGVCSPHRAALIARSDDSVNNGGTAVD